MTTQEQADRTAGLILELVQARRQLAALEVYRDALAETIGDVDPTEVAHELDLILKPQPAPTSGDLT